jgi:CRP-like cAMP-binding protein
MTHLRRGDADLHFPDGSHRTTPPSTSGRVLAAYERRIRAHLDEHRHLSEQQTMDDADHRIVEVVSDEGPTSARVIASYLGITTQEALRRLTKLRHLGVLDWDRRRRNGTPLLFSVTPPA